MAPRGRAPVRSGSPDRSYESSPDPLNASINSSPSKVRLTRKRTAQTPLASTSPSKQNRQNGLPEQLMEISSPSKSMVMNTGRQGAASPWRIKVTVEAEPENSSDAENTSPSVRHVERRTTTTVPLKYGDASSPPKRRGRPRKSDVAASTKTKRSGTPAKLRRRRSSVNEAASESSPLVPSSSDSPKKRRGRPRKNVQPEPEQEPQSEPEKEHIPETELGQEQEEESGAERLQPPILSHADDHEAAEIDADTTVIPIIKTTLATPQGTPVPIPSLVPTCLMPPQGQRGRGTAAFVEEYEEPVNFGTPPETDLRRRLKERKGTPHSKAVRRTTSTSDDESAIDTPSSTDEDQAQPKEAKGVRERLYLEAQLEALRRGERSESPDEDMDNYAFDEGETRMPDDTTVWESENFSMISVDSLLSCAAVNSPSDVGPTSAQDARAPQVLATSYLEIPTASSFTSGEASSQQKGISHIQPQASSEAPPSEQPQGDLPKRHVTPAMEQRSPSQPPALEPSHFSSSEVPQMDRAVTAGVALQGLMDPSRLTPQAKSEQRGNLEDLFRGFSDGTRRELQAGLRLGQQLAMCRENNPSSPLSRSPRPTLPDTSVKGGFVTHPMNRLLTPEDQDDHKSQSPVPTTNDNNANYPSLVVEGQQNSQLVSPDLSDHEMNCHSSRPGAVYSEKIQIKGGRTLLTATNPQGEQIRGPDVYVETRQDAAGQMVTAYRSNGEQISGPEISVIADEEEEGEEEDGERDEGGNDPKAHVVAGEQDYSDIWQEEASRSSSEKAGAPELQRSKTSNPRRTQKRKTKDPELQDAMTSDGPIPPLRAKLPRTWRRKPSSDFHYSDETEEEEDQPSGLSSCAQAAQESTKLEQARRHVQNRAILAERNIDGASEFSEEGGVFFHPEVPEIRSSRERRIQSLGDVSMSLLLDDGDASVPLSSPGPVTEASGASRYVSQSISPGSKTSPKSPGVLEKTEAFSMGVDEHSNHSSPAPAPARTPVSTKPNPFKDTPPRFTPRQFTPARSSPLRQELRDSETERSFDESSLPVSSPFHTQVDATNISIASHEQQFLQEMEGVTDSSIVRVRQEADARAEAYGSPYRTLHEIEEVTEMSKSRGTSIVMPSSPPVRISERESSSLIGDRTQDSTLLDNGDSLVPESVNSSILNSKRKHVRIAMDAEDMPMSSNRKTARHVSRPGRESPVVRGARPVQLGAGSEHSKSSSSTNGGVLDRLSSTLFGSNSTPAAQGRSSLPSPTRLAKHPVASDFTPGLPKVNPWTKTHYKTLDALFHLHRKDAALFDPASSEINAGLLDHFLAQPGNDKFLGAIYASWGYSVTITEPLLVIAAVFLYNILTLRDEAEYERLAGKTLVPGDVGPGRPGAKITAEAIMERLATVVMGRALRKDERKGIKVKKEGKLQVVWPGESSLMGV